MIGNVSNEVLEIMTFLQIIRPPADPKLWSTYTEEEINHYFERVNSVREGLILLVKGILNRLDYMEGDGISPSMDNYALIITYIGWLIWSNKQQKAITLIRGLIQLFDGMQFSEFIAGIKSVHPLAVSTISTVRDQCA